MDKRQIKIQRTCKWQCAFRTAPPCSGWRWRQTNAPWSKGRPRSTQTLQEGIRVQLKDLPAYLLAQVSYLGRHPLFGRGPRSISALSRRCEDISTLDSPADHHQPVGSAPASSLSRPGGHGTAQALGIASSEGRFSRSPS